MPAASDQVLSRVGLQQSCPFILDRSEAVNVIGMAAQEPRQGNLTIPVSLMQATKHLGHLQWIIAQLEAPTGTVQIRLLFLLKTKGRHE